MKNSFNVGFLLVKCWYHPNTKQQKEYQKMQIFMDIIYGIKDFFDILAAIPIFGPALVIGTSALIVAKAIRSR